MPPDRLFASTRGQILSLLWRNQHTVEELARALGLTDNAVRAQLAALERDDLVRPAGQRRGLRKPSIVYACAPAAERLLPKAYAPALAALLAELDASADPAAIATLLDRAGRRLATAYQARFAGLDDAGTTRALGQLLGELGGLVEIEERPGGYSIQGYSCPLAAVVAEHPDACRLTQALLQALLGEATVRECCQRNGAVRCRFEIDRPAQSETAPPA